MSNFINKYDFFAAITGKPVEWECPGVGTILIRGLTLDESNTLSNKYQNDGLSIMLEGITLGMVEPPLTLDDIASLRNAQPGVIQALGNKVMALSGLKVDEDLEKKAGNGS